MTYLHSDKHIVLRFGLASDIQLQKKQGSISFEGARSQVINLSKKANKGVCSCRTKVSELYDAGRSYEGLTDCTRRDRVPALDSPAQ